jgi:hypothetical protein
MLDMATPEEVTLFDPTPYADVRLALPEKLGRATGDYMGLTRYVELVLERSRFVAEPCPDPSDFVTIINGERSPDIEVPVAYTSSTYAADSDFDERFTVWQPSAAQDVVCAYLVGFPVLHGKDGSVNRTLHYWSRDESVFDDTKAVALTSIRKLTVFSQQYTDLMVELEHLAEGNEPQYGVPLLINRKSNEIVWRSAEHPDLLSVLDLLEEDARTVVFERPETSQHVQWRNEARLDTLLDSK